MRNYYNFNISKHIILILQNHISHNLYNLRKNFRNSKILNNLQWPLFTNDKYLAHILYIVVYIRFQLHSKNIFKNFILFYFYSIYNLNIVVIDNNIIKFNRYKIKEPKTFK